MRLFEMHTDVAMATYNPGKQRLYLKRWAADWQAIRQHDEHFVSLHRRGRGDAAYQAHIDLVGGPPVTEGEPLAGDQLSGTPGVVTGIAMPTVVGYRQ